MINFELSTFLLTLDDLTREQRLARFTANAKDDPVVDEVQHNHFRATAERMFQICGRLQLEGAATACLKLQDMFNRYRFQKYKYSDLAQALDRLIEDFRLEAMQEYFFHYPRETVRMIQYIDIEWKESLVAFPSSRREIVTAIDCYALGDYSGCVFHTMGLAEMGLRAIARERGIKSVGRNKPIEWGTWQDVFGAIETQLKAIRQARAGPKRDAALTFYDTALSDLRRLQGYRDQTMHFRAVYDRGEAYDAMHRAKSLMQTLSTKLDETRPRRTRWNL